MGTISVNLPSDGETADASDVSDPINTIVTEINGNLDNDNIDAAAAIEFSKLESAGWSSWSPTYINMNNDLTNSTVVAKYIQIGKIVHFRFKATLAGGDSPNAAGAGFDLPVTPHADYANNDAVDGAGRMTENGGSNYELVMVHNGSDGVTMRETRDNGNNTVYAQISTTSPFTWGNNDEIQYGGSYEAA